MIWITYDDRDERRRRRRRRWAWLLLLLAGLSVAAVLAVVGFSGDNSGSVDLAEPVTLQEALPALLTDHVTVVYVVDDSGSMFEKLLPLHQALHEVAAKHTENSEIAMLMFGKSHQMLFDFTEPSTAPWDKTIPSFVAGSGNTNMYQALQEALDMLPSRPTCLEKTSWLFFKETTCRQRRIVLMSDGIASDPHMAQEAMTALVRSGIPVDTVAFGEDADRKGLQNISDATGGRFIEAY